GLGGELPAGQDPDRPPRDRRDPGRARRGAGHRQGDGSAGQVLGDRGGESGPRRRDQGQGSGRHPVTAPSPAIPPSASSSSLEALLKERVALVLGGGLAMT